MKMTGKTEWSQSGPEGAKSSPGKMGLLRHCALSLMATMLLLPTSVFAAPTELERVVAIVDEDVVLASELRERIRMVTQQIEDRGVQPPSMDVLASQVLERLIMESIQLQMGFRAGVRIPDEMLNSTLADIAQQNQMTFEQFRVALAQDDMDYTSFREQVERELIVSRVQQNRVNNRISISEQEIENFLNSPMGEFQTADEYRIGHILLAIDVEANEDTVFAAEKAAQDIAARARAGEDFAQLAIENSAGSRALEGGDMGWRKPAQLPTLFADYVTGKTSGTVVDPIRSPSGIHIIKVLDRRGAGVGSVEEVHARHILIKPSEIRSEEGAQALADSVYERLQNGETFEDLASQYSEDPGSALNGGDLGWTQPNRFVDEFTAALRATPVGEVGKPFRSQFGFHVLQVLEWRTQDMSEEYRRRMAVRYLRGRRFDEELDAWMREIRDETYVDIKI